MQFALLRLTQNRPLKFCRADLLAEVKESSVSVAKRQEMIDKFEAQLDLWNDDAKIYLTPYMKATFTQTTRGTLDATIGSEHDQNSPFGM